MNLKSINISLILGLIVSVFVLVSAQEIASRDEIHDIELVRRAKGGNTASTSTNTSSSTSASNGKSTATTATKTNNHGGGNGGDGGGNNGLSFGSPAILENGTLFYVSLSVTCLLWATGKTIDVLIERLEKQAQTNVHKI